MCGATHREFESLSTRHHIKKHTELISKLQQQNLDFNNNLKHYLINLQQ
nr:MAG TPA: hypothetical protein [Caudoviricetes sp.]